MIVQVQVNRLGRLGQVENAKHRFIQITPDLHTAIMKSFDGYFYRLGLKMGLAGIMAMVDNFKLNERTGVDLPATRALYDVYFEKMPRGDQVAEHIAKNH